MDRKKPLRLTGRIDAAHDRFAPSGMSVRSLSPIVQAFVLAVPGATSAFAAPYDRNLSVIITPGWPRTLNNFLKKRIAAALFRWDWTRISRASQVALIAA